MADYFDGRPVLVTGVTGAEGTWLALVLARRGAQVIGVDRRPPTPASHFTLARAGEHVRFVAVDDRDVELVGRLIDGVDAVFAVVAPTSGEAGTATAGSGRRDAIARAVVLDAVRRSARCDRAVVLTTAEAHRSGSNDDRHDHRREDVLAGLDRSGKHLVVACSGNVLLGAEPHSGSVPGRRGRLHVDCFEALIDGRAPLVHDAARTSSHVYGLDLLRGCTTAAEHAHRPGVRGEVFDFGGPEAAGIENGVVATTICRAWGSGVRWEHATGHPEPVGEEPLDPSKSARVLGWRPAYSLDESVDDLARWYRVWGKRRAASATFRMDDIDGELIARYDAAVARCTAAADASAAPSEACSAACSAAGAVDGAGAGGARVR
jgi:CDP-glucose 4,6-dehydratase